MFWTETMSRHNDLVRRMGEAVGADPARALADGTLTPQGLRSAVLRCTGCSHTEECQHFLADHPSGAGAAPDYCLNAALLSALAEEAAR
jgi:hypothetical protein